MKNLFTTSGLPPAIRSTGWFIYQDYDGLWYARNPLTEGRCIDGKESIDEVVEVLEKSFSTKGLWMGQIGKVQTDGTSKIAQVNGAVKRPGHSSGGLHRG